MARKSGSAVVPGQEQLPVQPVDRPILCNPYEEPRDHWIYDKDNGAASRAGSRRKAGEGSRIRLPSTRSRPSKWTA